MRAAELVENLDGIEDVHSRRGECGDVAGQSCGVAGDLKYEGRRDS